MNFNMFNAAIQIPVVNLPINLLLSLDGTIAFIRTRHAPTIIDQPESGIEATFTDECFYIGDESISYDYGVGYPYQDLPQLKQWLQQQNLEMP